MFDLYSGKLMLVGCVALVVVGPKDLPAALRLAGRAFAQLRRFQSEARRTAESLMAETSLERELAPLAAPAALALNPATAMRGHLGAAAPAAVEADLLEFATPEMRAYLAPPEAQAAQPEAANLEAQPCAAPPA